jgi:hypothetical protein
LSVFGLGAKLTAATVKSTLAKPTAGPIVGLEGREKESTLKLLVRQGGIIQSLLKSSHQQHCHQSSVRSGGRKHTKVIVLARRNQSLLKLSQAKPTSAAAAQPVKPHQSHSSTSQVATCDDLRCDLKSCRKSISIALNMMAFI